MPTVLGRKPGGGGGGGSLPDPFVVTGTDPETVTATIQGAPNQDEPVLVVESEEGGVAAISVIPDAAGGISRVTIEADGGFLQLGGATGIARLSGPTAIIFKVPIAEPSDSLLNQFGQVIMWVTNTAGSAKLSFKTLDSDEVVVSGEIALTP